MIVGALRTVYPPGYNSERNAQRITSPLVQGNRPTRAALVDVPPAAPGLRDVVRSDVEGDEWGEETRW